MKFRLGPERPLSVLLLYKKQTKNSIWYHWKTKISIHVKWVMKKVSAKLIRYRNNEINEEKNSRYWIFEPLNIKNWVHQIENTLPCKGTSWRSSSWFWSSQRPFGCIFFSKIRNLPLIIDYHSEQNFPTQNHDGKKREIVIWNLSGKITTVKINN